ncbi:MAG TPA: hypothetical protein VK209_09600 [Candidatus Sulfotelmatobacter sp.]|nr:hypothetical protein [Candidatus Sulfotelmatobacter sp.]
MDYILYNDKNLHLSLFRNYRTVESNRENQQARAATSSFLHTLASVIAIPIAVVIVFVVVLVIVLRNGKKKIAL